ncbi:MAG: hypothetical protein LBD82_03640 [Deltaproteobacteria bacterium]|jgi:hypothetical protein|nr:hypothetical protein [Deltaproteobacteria bacterium]
MSRFLWILCSLIFLSLLCPLRQGRALGEPAAQTVTGIARRPSAGPITAEMAFTAAAAAARQQALRRIALTLLQFDDIRPLLDNSSPGTQPKPDPEALALALLQGLPPPSMRRAVLKPPQGTGEIFQHEARIYFHLEAEQLTRAKVLGLLERPLDMDYYARALLLEKKALDAYDAAATAFLEQTPPKGENPITDLRQSASGLSAASAYLALLPELRRDAAIDAPLRPALEEELKRLQDDAPQNYLLHAELGLVMLLLHNPLEARRRLDEAVRLEENFAAARDLRGVALLLLELPVLALEDFNRAILLAPQFPSFYENRALALYQLQRPQDMCQDLNLACSMGRCAGLEWAAAAGHCRY